jgi:hypothetical protein
MSPLGRPRLRLKINIKMDLLAEGCGDTNWMDLAQDKERWRAVVNAVMNLGIP